MRVLTPGYVGGVGSFILYIEYAYNDHFDRSGVSAICNNSFWYLANVYLL